MRERVHEIEPISIGMLDYFGLYGCELQYVVGKRNSSLGRVAHPLTRLDYERRFIIAAETCSETFERYVAAVLDERTENNHWRAFDQAIAQHTRALPEAGSEVLNVC